MKLLLAVLVLPAVLGTSVARAQWSDDRIENLRIERRVARDAAFVGVVAGTIGALIAVPLVIATALDPPSSTVLRYGSVTCDPSPCPHWPSALAAARRRWEEQLVGSAIGAGISVAMLAVSIATLALVPSPDTPVPLRVRIGPGSLSIDGTF